MEEKVLPVDCFERITGTPERQLLLKSVYYEYNIKSAGFVLYKGGINYG